MAQNPVLDAEKSHEKTMRRIPHGVLEINQHRVPHIFWTRVIETSDQHGVPRTQPGFWQARYTRAMPRSNPVQRATFDEFLKLEEQSSVRHEFVDGFMFAMAGGTDWHNRIAGNIYARVLIHSEDTECNRFMNDMLIRTPDDIGYYPDVFVTCEESTDGSRVKRKPCFVIEVLSDSTEAIDRGEKLHNYRKIPSLQAYILVSQDRKLIEVFRRLPDQTWRYETLEDGALELPCVGLMLPLDDAYRGVNFAA